MEPRICPLTPALGAEVEGIDLGALDAAGFAALHRAFLEHQVLFVSDQRLTPQAQVALAARFGPPSMHPMMETLPGHPEVLAIVKDADDRNNFGGDWHTDLSYVERPALASVLYGVEIPPVGGDTLFASTYLAYETLSPGLKAVLGRLRAVHSTTKVYYPAAQEAGIIGNAASMRRAQAAHDAQEAEHPVVRTHPETGRPALYVNPVFTTRFAGMTEEESRPLLEHLWRHTVRPEHTCRFRWRPGTVAIWDNRCTQHYALNDYHGQRRVMHRVTVEGDRPY